MRRQKTSPATDSSTDRAVKNTMHVTIPSLSSLWRPAPKALPVMTLAPVAPLVATAMNTFTSAVEAPTAARAKQIVPPLSGGLRPFADSYALFCALRHRPIGGSHDRWIWQAGARGSGKNLRFAGRHGTANYAHPIVHGREPGVFARPLILPHARRFPAHPHHRPRFPYPPQYRSRAFHAWLRTTP